MSGRHLALHAPGVVLVSTDVHGNLRDFGRMAELFEAERLSNNVPVHWVVLGDVVHGPSEQHRHRFEGMLDYDDESSEIVAKLIELRAAHPDHVHFVLGNHDYAHIGGPRTSKFHGDEAEWLESQMTPDEIEAMRALFLGARLAISTDCGVLMTHGSPDEKMESLERIDAVVLPARGADHEVVHDMLFAYGQRGEDTDRALELLSEHPAFPHAEPLRVVLHGHDRDEDGFYFDDHNQVCPVIFGAHDPNKRYTRLDLSERYESVDDFVDGEVLLKLHGP